MTTGKKEMEIKFKSPQQVTACPAGKLPAQEVEVALGNPV
jgi:hypothetical protein